MGMHSYKFSAAVRTDIYSGTGPVCNLVIYFFPCHKWILTYALHKGKTLHRLDELHRLGAHKI